MTGLIQGRTGDWEIVVGLEVHAQVLSEGKLFSSAPTAFGGNPNRQVSLVDAAMPGMLPVLNRECVRQAVRTGIGLRAEINRFSVFDRKNYFYPDLPQGYQISQYKQPIVGRGAVSVDLADGEKTVRIERLHLEQDAGKSLHDRDPRRSFIDLNRSGVALMEIVSEPDIRSAAEASAYVRKLRSILRYLGTCDGNMEEGSLRADANVSVRRPGDAFGTRCEIKNLNSMRFLQQAIDYEARRQVAVIEDGGTIAQQTMLFDTTTGQTRPMRSKEDAHDYRYFPDPDLLPLVLSEAFVAEIEATVPELPDAKLSRFVSEYGMTRTDALLLVEERETARFFEALVDGRDRRLAANWMLTELFGALNRSGTTIGESPVSAEALGGLIDLIADGTISGRIAKDVFAEMFESGAAAATIVDTRGLRQIVDADANAALVDAVLQEQADKVEEYRAGKDRLFGFFVGQVMKRSQGKANPQVVNQLLKDRLQH